MYPAELLEAGVRIAARCSFSLDALRYEYPHELVPEGETPASYLRRLTLEGARGRWPEGVPGRVLEQVESELATIAELRYEFFFLTVHDIVAEARRRQILCQGRGSAANSAVCFCLGITEVDPAKARLLFARFLSKERNEPPDIDVDFEHERREEILQYVYAKYGRHRAALAATVVSYRPKSALRDLGRALGLTLDQVERFGKALAWWEDSSELPQRLAEQGFDPAAAQTRRLLKLVEQLLGFPRHLSQHVGGFVISEHALSELVPVENAAMPDRTIIQWDKDDLETLGLLKVDCLALGMLTALHRAFDLVKQVRGVAHTIASIEHDDPKTFEMIRASDTIGVFQIESRAQMSMLPRLKPEKFYDLVVEVAIVRPGPIQGKMVHPYLRRKNGEEAVEFPSEAIRPVLERTLGVPIFQEQVMDLAIVAAGFAPEEADGLRRAMAAWKRHGGLEPWRQRLFAGMRAHGYDDDFAARIFEQIKGFGSYGFPESHAASFAKLAYVSAWLKCHEPAAFTCALLNSQPMGFYAPSQLVQDAQRHGVEVRGVDVCHSDWDCTLEARPEAVPPKVVPGPRVVADGPCEVTSQPALRLGLRQVRGLKASCGERVSSARAAAPFEDVADLVARARLDAFERGRLADAGALRTLAGHRHRARWAVQGAEAPPRVLEHARIAEAPIRLKPPSTRRDVHQDYATMGLTLGPHPVALIRQALRARHARTATELGRLPHGSRTRAAGLVIGRQHPETASGITFVTIEDETGIVNIVVRLETAHAQRRELLESRLLAVDGTLERVEGVQHLIARRLHSYDPLLGDLQTHSRDFH
ncbi:MAG TPA: error-prone DNA polymerase [Candidatus Saccharimonadia bacterium]|nr:error-prone DNA polymerase [Candidatus Saccharimonadia bacterium]